MLGEINIELVKFSEQEERQNNKPDYMESLICWNQKKQIGKICHVRQRGTAGNRKKCRICLDKLTIELFGI